MNRGWGKLIVFAVVLLLSALACTVFEYGEGERGEADCDDIGGLWMPSWNEGEGFCVNPYEGDTPRELRNECVIDPSRYETEFANVNYENSNDTKKVCQGDFIIWNIGDEKFDYKLYEYWDNNAMQDIGWQNTGRLGPGEEISLPIETQTWSDHETVATYTQIVVFRTTPECAVFLEDEKYEYLLEKISVPLADPCR